jgi:tripartite-type tricarboxylate transporter receptor subunit TctC
MKIIRMLSAAIGLTAFAAATTASAQDWPTKPVTIVLPYGTGSAADIVARVLAPQLTAELGQNFLVVNKPGAFGMIALQEVVRQPADGYTLEIGNTSSNAVTPVLFKDKIKFDYKAKIRAVTKLVELPAMLLVSGKDFSPRSMAELIAYAKEHPGQVRYSTTGIGSFVQFDTELLSKRAGIKMVHLPIKGGAGDIVNALANGDSQVAFMNVATGEGMLKAGKVFPIATIGETRLPSYPNVPTFAELGFPGVGTALWNVLCVHADTPQPIVDKLFKAVIQALGSEQSKKVFGSTGVLITPSASPEDAEKWQLAQLKDWEDITAQIHIDVE